MKNHKYNPNTDYADRYRSVSRKRQKHMDEELVYKMCFNKLLSRRLYFTIWAGYESTSNT